MTLPREAVNDIAGRLNLLAAIVKTRSRASLTDANRLLETIAKRFFNALFGWNLVNLNTEQPNYPAADLGDRGRRIAIQITNEGGSDKITHTAAKAAKHRLSADFDRLIVFFLLPTKPGFPKKFKQPTDGPNVETWDIADLLKEMQDQDDLEALTRAAKVLAEEVGRIAAPCTDRKFDISRILKYAPAQLIGREDELKLLNDAWTKARVSASPRPRVLAFVALGGEGKTSLVAKWAAELAGQDWPGCEAAFAWSFYSQGTREQQAASSDLFLKEALTFFGDEATAGSAAGAYEKGRKLVQLVGERRALLILDGLEPLQYAPSSPTAGELKDQGIAALLKGLAAASHSLCVVTTRYSLPDLKAFWQTTAKEDRLLRLSREAGVHLLKSLGVEGSELRNIPLDLPSHTEALKRAEDDSPGQRPGLTHENDPALKGRDNTVPCAAPTGHDDWGNAETQGVALGCHLAGRWPARADDGRELVNEYEKLVEDVKGHALTLTLLGAFLKRAFHGDIRQRDRVKFEKADALMDGGHAFRTMAAYEQWLLRDGGEEGRREVAVLRLMGLFDRPADAGCLHALLQPPAIPGLTEPLVGLAEDDWNSSLDSLESARLLTVNRDRSELDRSSIFLPTSIDAHPLLRAYFAQRIRGERRATWRAGHHRLYKHLCSATPDKPQPRLEDLEPLYQAMAHGCQAELHADAFRKVYQKRIIRGGAYYSLSKLGALSSDLGALARLFTSQWVKTVPALAEPDQAWILRVVAYDLMALGRVSDSLAPAKAAFELYTNPHGWRPDPVEAALSASSLATACLFLGFIEDAITHAANSVEQADRSADWAERINRRTNLAWALLERGDQAKALQLLQQAECIQGGVNPSQPLLKAIQGWRYCELLLQGAETTGWRRWLGIAHPDASSNLDSVKMALAEVQERVLRTLAWAMTEEAVPIRLALNRLTQAKVYLLADLIDVEHKSELSAAHRHVEEALTNVSKSSEASSQPLVLLTRAWVLAHEGHEACAKDALNEAWNLAQRGPFRLRMADIHLYRARLFFREKEYPWESPAADLAAAEKLINECGYHRRDEELADAKRAILGT